MTEHKHLRRLERVWINDPIFFITTCTYHRRPILAASEFVEILRDEWAKARGRHGWAVGSYVVMPDHVHFFCAPDSTAEIDQSKTMNPLSDFMLHWKQWTSKWIIEKSKNTQFELVPPVWQEGFFDHVLRSEERYAQKWQYVRENPLRAGLVERVEDWLWQGEIYQL